MARIWPIQPEIPNPTLATLARSMVSEAERLLELRAPGPEADVPRRLRKLPRDRGHPRRDPRLKDLILQDADAHRNGPLTTEALTVC